MANIEWNGGVRVPLNCNDKSTRSIYRLCQKESACIQDQSYFAHFLVSQSAFQTLLQSRLFILKQQNCTMTGLSSASYTVVSGSERRLVGFMDVITLNETNVLLMLHPSIVQQVREELFSTLPLADRSAIEQALRPLYLNDFIITSKNIGLLQLYNVLQPLAHNPESAQVLDSFAKSLFDDNLLESNSVLALDLTRSKIQHPNFRMNERIFREELCSFKTPRQPFSDSFGCNRKFTKVQDQKHYKDFPPNQGLVHKACLAREESTM
jgi:hypothetical protein